MLHAKQFNLVNKVLKHIRRSEEPFGGIQLVVAAIFFSAPRRFQGNQSRQICVYVRGVA